MDRRSFMKAIGLAPAALLTAKAVAAEEVAKTVGCAHKPKCETILDVVRRKREEERQRLMAKMDEIYFAKPIMITKSQARIMFPKLELP